MIIILVLIVLINSTLVRTCFCNGLWYLFLCLNIKTDSYFYMFMCCCTWSSFSSPCIGRWCLDPILPSQSAFQFSKHKHAIPYDVTRCKQWTFIITPLHFGQVFVPIFTPRPRYTWAWLLFFVFLTLSAPGLNTSSQVFHSYWVSILTIQRGHQHIQPLRMYGEAFLQTNQKHMFVSTMFLSLCKKKTKEQMYCQSCVYTPF